MTNQDSWSLRIDGQPVAKGRPRMGKGRTYTPEKTVRWERKAALLMHEAWPGLHLVGPVKLSVQAVCKRPKRRCRKIDPEGLIWRCATPDADNVLKAVADALEKSEVIANDSQCVDVYCQSLYGHKNEEGYVAVYISRVGSR